LPRVLYGGVDGTLFPSDMGTTTGAATASSGPPPQSEGASQVVPRFYKLEFTTYNGLDDPLNWLNHCEQLFSGQQTPPADYTWLAAYHLRGDALTWYFTLVQDEGQPSWERLKELCHLQFGPPVCGSRLAELGRIHFHSIVQDYTDRFNMVLCHAQNLDSSQKVDLYVGGLPDHIRVDVELCTPRDLPTAVYLARLFELRARSLLAQRPPETPRFCCQSRPVRAARPPCHRWCHHQPTLPSQAHSSRQCNSRSVSFAASRRRNRWSDVVRGYAITVMSPSSAVTSASACSTLSWVTTRTMMTPPRPRGDRG
jgi:hypothetical protein